MKKYQPSFAKFVNEIRQKRRIAYVEKVILASAAVSMAVYGGAVALDSAIVARADDAGENHDDHVHCIHCGQHGCNGECVGALERADANGVLESKNPNDYDPNKLEALDKWVERSLDEFTDARDIYQGTGIEDDVAFKTAYDNVVDEINAKISSGDLNPNDAAEIQRLIEDACGKLGYFQYTAEQYQGKATDSNEINEVIDNSEYGQKKSEYEQLLATDTSAMDDDELAAHNKKLEELIVDMKALKGDVQTNLEDYGAVGEFESAKIDFDVGVIGYIAEEKENLDEALAVLEEKTETYLGDQGNRTTWDGYNSVLDAVNNYHSDQDKFPDDFDWLNYNQDEDDDYQQLLANLKQEEAAIAQSVDGGTALGSLGDFISAKHKSEEAKAKLDAAGEDREAALAAYQGQIDETLLNAIDSAKAKRDEAEKSRQEFADKYQSDNEGNSPDEWYNNLQNDPEYQALLSELGLAEASILTSEEDLIKGLQAAVAADENFDPGALGNFYLAKIAHDKAQKDYNDANDAADDAEKKYDAAVKKLGYARDELNGLIEDPDSMTSEQKEELRALLKELAKDANQGTILELWDTMMAAYDNAQEKGEVAEKAREDMLVAYKEADRTYLQYEATVEAANEIAEDEYKQLLGKDDFTNLIEALNVYASKTADDPYLEDVLREYYGDAEFETRKAAALLTNPDGFEYIAVLWEKLTKELSVEGLSEVDDIDAALNLRLNLANAIAEINRQIEGKIVANDLAKDKLAELQELLERIANIPTAGKTQAEIKAAIEALTTSSNLNIWDAYEEALKIFVTLDSYVKDGTTPNEDWFKDLYDKLINKDLEDADIDALSTLKDHLNSVKGQTYNKLQVGDAKDVGDAQGARNMVSKSGLIYERIRSGGSDNNPTYYPASLLETDSEGKPININLRMTLVKAGNNANNKHYMKPDTKFDLMEHDLVDGKEVPNGTIELVDHDTKNDNTGDNSLTKNKSKADKAIVDALFAKLLADGKIDVAVEMDADAKLPADMNGNIIIKDLDGNVIVTFQPFVTVTSSDVMTNTSTRFAKGALVTVQPGVSVNILHCLVDNNWQTTTLTNDTLWPQHYILTNFHYHETAFSINYVKATPTTFDGVDIPEPIKKSDYEAPPKKDEPVADNLLENEINLVILPEDLPLPPSSLNPLTLPDLTYPIWEVEEAPEKPEIPEEPYDPENPEIPEDPEDPEIPEVPEDPEDPEIPENPEDPEIPQIPQIPEIPQFPNDPQTPVTPQSPDPVTPATETPATPAQTLAPLPETLDFTTPPAPLAAAPTPEVVNVETPVVPVAEAPELAPAPVEEVMDFAPADVPLANVETEAAPEFIPESELDVFEDAPIPLGTIVAPQTSDVGVTPVVSAMMLALLGGVLLTATNKKRDEEQDAV